MVTKDKITYGSLNIYMYKITRKATKEDNKRGRETTELQIRWTKTK